MKRMAKLTGSERRYRIRRIFLRRQDWYTLKHVTRLTGITAIALRAMIDAGELEAHPSEKAWEKASRIRWPQLAALALETWPIEVIEQELGEEAAQVLPPLVRTTEVTVRLPRYLFAMLHLLAKREGLSPSLRIADALTSIAEEHAASLEEDIPGFGEAMNFPEG